ncbi:response regulator [Candidatus Obscuribacterales bacterium]|nr:response regulator [Candidatus Obscuribacterales bacterium]
MAIENKQILLVEDTLTQAMLYQHMLEKRGFQVKIARSGKQALEQIEKEKPAVVLTDINMPDMNGFELSNAIKTSDTTRDIIVVLLTTTLSPQTIFDCINCGADEISLKGLTEDAFLQLMKRSAERQIELKEPASDLHACVTEADVSSEIKCSNRQSLRLLLSIYDLLVKVQEN